MSRDFIAYLEHFNTHTNQWEAVQVFTHNRWSKDHALREVPLLDGGWGENASILTRDSLYPELTGIENIPNNLSPSVQKEVDKLYNENNELEVGYFELASINVANLKIYTLKYPTIKDFDAAWPEDVMPDDPKIPRKDNPIKYLLDKIFLFLDICDIWDNNYANLRLIYWGNC